MYNDRILAEAGNGENRPPLSEKIKIKGHSSKYDLHQTNPSLGRRGLDIFIAGLALVFFSPLIVVLSVFIYIENPGPVFYGQRRLGRDGKLFRCWKLRSMMTDADQELENILRSDPRAAREWRACQKLRSDPRVTKVGRVMRLTSMDEIPQLLNILAGDMSIVGPRPITADEAPRYGRHIRAYSSVNPGLTGLWQVCGRSNTTYRRRVALDVMYTRRRNLILDAWIIIMTVPAVFGRKGSC